MPKRKKDKSNDCDLDYLERKLRKLERKISRRRRRHTSSPDGESITLQNPNHSEPIATIDVDVSEPQAGCSYWDEVLEQSNVSTHDTNVADIAATTTAPIPNALPQLEPHVDIVTPNAPTAALPDAPSEPVLDPELLSILGEDPTAVKKFGENIQKDLAVRLSHIVTTGLSKENRKELKEKYLIPANCKLIKAPALNAEFRASLAESQVKRDKGIENKQILTSCALSSLCAAITLLLSSKNANQDLLKLLMDSARILGDIQHSDSVLRRFFILTTVKKELKEQLEKTKIDELLFGDNLAETLKTAKIINKSGADIRSTAKSGADKSSTTATATSRQTLNYRAPLASQRAPPPPATARGYRPPARQPAARRTATATQCAGSSRTSSHQQRPRHRR